MQILMNKTEKEYGVLQRYASLQQSILFLSSLVTQMEDDSHPFRWRVRNFSQLI